MFLSLLTYLLLISALLVVGFMMIEPTSMQEFGEPQDHGLGYLAATAITVSFIVILESVSALLSLCKVKDDFAQEVYDLAEKNKRDK